jgi:DNA polymerase bacteriophage-type
MGPRIVTTAYHDLETHSSVPIKFGVDAYRQAVRVLLWAYAIGDGPVAVWDVASGEAMPTDLKAALDDPGCIHVWHNGGMFDLPVLEQLGIQVPIERVHDTLVMALSHSLPGSLGKLCEIFQLPQDQSKDKEGRALIRLFCVPPKKGPQPDRSTHPKQWEAFKAYARLDIEAMRAIYQRMPRWNMTPTEREVWLLDQKINRRGICVDVALAEGALRSVERALKVLDARTKDLTFEAVASATQRDAMLQHLAEVWGLALEDVRGSTLERALEDDTLPAELRELLSLRLQTATTSTAKYRSLLNSVGPDGRLRFTKQFCGAARTGRWAGRIFQPDNLPRPNLEQPEIEAGIDAFKADCADLVLDNVMETASNALRGVIVAPPGKKLVVADLSNIEGRVLAWLAGETWKLKAFEAFDRGEGPDLYKVTAGRILGKAPEDVTKKERQEVGKVAELALGYEGGVGAFLTFATAYGIDLDALAAIARENLEPRVVTDSAGLYDWFKEQKKSTHGLDKLTWIGIDAIKRAWREAHPATAQLWKDLGDDAREAFFNPGMIVGSGKLAWQRKGSWLLMRLPSGRCLCYPAASFDSGKLSYKGVNQYTRQWDRISSYGGKLAENATQATARDVLAAGMLQAENNGFDIVLSVHDELITEVFDKRLAKDAAELAFWMTYQGGFQWAEGLPLAAAGFETYRYRKD